MKIDSIGKKYPFMVTMVKAQGPLKDNIIRTINLLGGLGNFFKPGQKILIKPNFNTADLPPGSSDPLFIKALIEIFMSYGLKVIVGEASTFSQDTRKNLKKTGMLTILEKMGVETIIFPEKKYFSKKIPGKFLKKVHLPQILEQIDHLVYACCLKTHRLSDFTMSLKLGVGFAKRWERLRLHLSHLEEKIVDLNLLLKPRLIIMDARVCFISGGPDKGERRQPNLILASNDRIALDVEGIKIIQSFANNALNKPAWQYPQIKLAASLGLGAKSDQDYQIITS